MFTLLISLVCRRIANEKNERQLLMLIYMYRYASVFSSKWIGLFLFLISNVTTGIINIAIRDTSKISDEKAQFIISSYLFFVFYVSFLIYKRMKFKENKKYVN